MTVARTTLLTGRTTLVDGGASSVRHSSVFFGGSSGGGGSSQPLRITIGSATTDWPLPHNLGYLPQIQCFDAGNVAFDARIENGTMTSYARMSAPVAGYALIK